MKRTELQTEDSLTQKTFTLSTLPPPPPDKSGWPWTVTDEAAATIRAAAAALQVASALKSPTDPAAAWPTITIVTPSYGQGQYIEATLRSVLLQGYPKVEYLVMDGGSRDETVEILKKYDAHITSWVSESDRGQTHAINKGFQRATGDIIAWLNSDDFYMPGALWEVARAFVSQPEADVVYGAIRYMEDDGTPQERHAGRFHSFAELADLWEVWWGGRQVVQPEVFWRRSLYKQCGPLDESLYYVMDYEYWLRMSSRQARFVHVPVELASFRRTATQKSNASEDVAREHMVVLHRYLSDSQVPLTKRQRFRLLANWTYVTYFMGTSAQCEKENVSTPRRWLRLMVATIRHPRMLTCPSFLQRSIFCIPNRLKRLLYRSA